MFNAIGSLIARGASAFAGAGGFLSNRLSGALDRGADRFLDSGLNMGFNGVLGKIFGGPEGPPSAGQMGYDAKQFFDNAFPGTNAWERLGNSSPTGS